MRLVLRGKGTAVRRDQRCPMRLCLVLLGFGSLFFGNVGSLRFLTPIHQLNELEIEKEGELVLLDALPGNFLNHLDCFLGSHDLHLFLLCLLQFQFSELHVDQLWTLGLVLVHDGLLVLDLHLLEW